MAALPVTIALKKIKCRIETDEVGSDEPYVLVTAVDLANPLLPNAEVTLYGPWGDVDAGESRTTQPLQPGIAQHGPAAGAARWGTPRPAARR